MNYPSYKDIRHEIANNGFNVRDEFKHLTIPELNEVVQSDRLPFTVAMFNITGDLNVGTMIRTVHCLGARKVFIFGRRAVDSRSLVGVQNYFDIKKIPAMKTDTEIDEDVFWQEMETEKQFPIFVETGGTSYLDMDWDIIGDREPCFVFGNEGMGIPVSMTEGNTIVSIPQRGVTRSFNVSAACAIVVSHYVNFG